MSGRLNNPVRQIDAFNGAGDFASRPLLDLRLDIQLQLILVKGDGEPRLLYFGERKISNRGKRSRKRVQSFLAKHLTYGDQKGAPLDRHRVITPDTDDRITELDAVVLDGQCHLRSLAIRLRGDAALRRVQRDVLREC